MSARTRALFALICMLFVVPTAAQAATRMPIGFYDDASFRWSPDRLANLATAAAAGADVIHTNANWATIAPTRPANALNGDDPAYRLADLDQLVAAAPQYGLRVMVTVVGTPRWANGGRTPNHMPRRLSDLTAFSRMLATRYNGLHGHGTVSIWSVWNEPNLQLFLAPQYVGKKMVGPANYVKLYKAVYAGLHAGNRSAAIAIGETSPEGRDKPIKTKGQGQSIAPATFARLVARAKGLKFTAWAHHPYPPIVAGKALGAVRYPNVNLSQLHRFEKDLNKWFHRKVAIWITEYGHQARPAQPKGVTTAVQAKYARQALTFAKRDPNVQMFVWFTLRDSASNPWKSGVEVSSGARRPSFNAFASIARGVRGTLQTVTKHRRPTVILYVPEIAYYSPTGSTVGITYTIRNKKGQVVGRGEPQSYVRADQSVSFVPTLLAAPDETYTVTAVVNDASGHTEPVATLLVTS
ncbi:MAG TPA: cellulase family glycosylhydrolase [Gaiellaceae bacterium]|nr:cellulase family glycosylhydrolase [Gaiellaceae bacterium]